MKVIALALLAAAAGWPADAPAGAAVPPVATKVLGVFEQLRAAGEPNAKGGRQHVAFQFSEAEINQYMQYSLKTTPRPGVESVNVKFFPKNYVSTFTVVDFDAVERWKPGTIPKLLRPMLSGKKSVWVDYRFQANDGKGTFSVEKAYYGDVRLPGFVVEKMIEILAARQPEHYDTTKPLPLPFGLRQVWTAEHTVAGRN
jgi:hypothetical protein